MHAIPHERFLRLRRMREAAPAAEGASLRVPGRQGGRRIEPGPGGGALSFDLATAGDAEDFRCAFYRFVELKSRAVVDPAAGCSIAVRRSGAGRVAQVDLWSRRAAAEFAGFWPRYAQVYGRRSAFRG